MGLKILIVVLCLFIPYISYIISFVGVADIYIDVRKFIENRDGTNNMKEKQSIRRRNFYLVIFLAVADSPVLQYPAWVSGRSALRYLLLA